MEKSQKKNFCCNLCDYITTNKYDYEKHILTRKHRILTDTNRKIEIKIYKCPCGKKYRHSSSLCKHRKTCNEEEINELQLIEYDSTSIFSSDMFMEFLKESKEAQTFFKEQQKELHNTIIELAKNQNITNNNNNINTTNNNQFKIGRAHV